jgi:hypothetical protein
MDETKPKPFIFVLMPFSESFIDVYEAGIKPACKDAGAYCERVDEQIFVESILERVYNQIAKADVVVAEMTGRNPNVFYETGYAHALNKRVILLTQNADDIPFDLKHYPHIVYGGKIAPLKSQLEARIRWCVENPRNSLSVVDTSFEVFIDGISLINSPEIPLLLEETSSTWASTHLQISIHNLSTKVVSPESLNVAIVTPNHVDISKKTFLPRTRLPDGRILHALQHDHLLFPDGWLPLEIPFHIRHKDYNIPETNMLLRLFTELEPKDYSFTVTRL